MTFFLFLAFLTPLVWAIVNHIDKYAVERFMQRRDPGALIIFTGLAALVIGVFVRVFAPIEHLTGSTALVMIAAGMLLVFSYIPYLYALGKDEASNVAPLFQLVTPFVYILALIFLKESLALPQLVAGTMIFMGAIILSVDFGNMHLRFRSFMLMVLASLMIAGNVVIFKGFALHTSFWTTVYYDLVGAALAGLLLFAFIGKYRRDCIGAVREFGSKVVSINLLAESLSITARMVTGFVSLFIPLAVTQFVIGFQPLFILLIGIILTKLAPHLGEELIDRRSLVRKFSAIILMCGGLALLSFFL